jgi:hypothetical protein
MRSVSASIIVLAALMGCCCPPFGQFGPAPPPPVVVNPPPGQEPRCFVGEKFAFIQRCVQNGHTRDDIKGFTLSEFTYRDAPLDGAVLIGFQARLEKLNNEDVIVGIQPIFLTRGGEKIGGCNGRIVANSVTIKAKPGYCVGSLNIQSGARLDGFSVKFMKLENDRLNPDDHYTSDWVGGQGGVPDIVGGNGVLAVGICGHLNDGVPSSIGLVAANLAN